MNLPTIKAGRQYAPRIGGTIKQRYPELLETLKRNSWVSKEKLRSISVFLEDPLREYLRSKGYKFRVVEKGNVLGYSLIMSPQEAASLPIIIDDCGEIAEVKL